LAQEDKTATKGRKPSWLGWLPFALLAALLLAALGFYIMQRVGQQQAQQQQQAANDKLGIPADYPGQIIPVYPGVKIVKAEKGTAKSKDGEVMDKWYIHATTTESCEKLHDYYVSLANKLNLSQTMGIQIPTGYGTNYANDKLEVDFVIEVRPPDKLTQLEITLYMLKKGA
jgi:hypothetical protein